MKFNTLVFPILFLVFYSCKTENVKESQKSLLQGKWNLVSATRNGSETESLVGTFFEFTADKMSTNLPIRGGTDSPFVIEENVIIQTVVSNTQVKYGILELTPTTLKVSTKLKETDFVFTFEKGK